MSDFLLIGRRGLQTGKHFYKLQQLAGQMVQVDSSHDYGATFTTVYLPQAVAGPALRTSPSGRYVAVFGWDSRELYISRDYGATFEHIAGISNTIDRIRNIQLFNDGRLAAGVFVGGWTARVIVARDYTLSTSLIDVAGHLLNRATPDRVLVKATLQPDAPAWLLNVWSGAVGALPNGVAQYVSYDQVHAYYIDGQTKVYVSVDSENAFNEYIVPDAVEYITRLALADKGKQLSIVANYTSGTIGLTYFNPLQGLNGGAFDPEFIGNGMQGLYYSWPDPDDELNRLLYAATGSQFYKWRNGQEYYAGQASQIAVNTNYSHY